MREPTIKEETLIRGISFQLCKQFRTIPLEDLRGYCYAAWVELVRESIDDPDAFLLADLLKGLRRHAIGLMQKDGTIRRSDRESVWAMTTEWPTSPEGVPMDFPDTGHTEETLTETLEGITTLTLREQEILYHRHVVGRTREETKAVMCHSEFDYQVLIKSARLKAKEALTS